MDNSEKATGCTRKISYETSREHHETSAASRVILKAVGFALIAFGMRSVCAVAATAVCGGAEEMSVKIYILPLSAKNYNDRGYLFIR